VLSSLDTSLTIQILSIPTIGGFQTPIEKDCLEILLNGSQPVTVCPARGVGSIDRQRLPASWRRALDEGRLTLLSPFGPEVKRPTKALAAQRNAFVLERAAALLVLHASPGGQTEALAQSALAAGKSVVTLDHPANAHLVALGARPVTPDDAWFREWAKLQHSGT
jgi:hypothetical protein